MIFKSDIKRLVTDYAAVAFKEYPSWIKICLDEAYFDKWCELCCERLIKVDNAGWVKSKEAALWFIRKAADAYFIARLEKHVDAIDKMNPRKEARTSLTLDVIKLPDPPNGPIMGPLACPSND